MPATVAAVGSLALIGGAVVLAYADRHLVPASLNGWTVSNISRATGEWTTVLVRDARMCPVKASAVWRRTAEVAEATSRRRRSRSRQGWCRR